MIVDTDTAKKWTRNPSLTGSVLIDKKGRVSIDYKKTNNWYDNHPEYLDVLVTGPLLIAGKEKNTASGYLSCQIETSPNLNWQERNP